jgi:hypothetical protein
LWRHRFEKYPDHIAQAVSINLGFRSPADAMSEEQTCRSEVNGSLPLIIMKAMNSVTAVIKITDRGGKPLWNTSHWTFTRSTPGHE